MITGLMDTKCAFYRSKLYTAIIRKAQAALLAHTAAAADAAWADAVERLQRYSIGSWSGRF